VSVMFTVASRTSRRIACHLHYGAPLFVDPTSRLFSALPDAAEAGSASARGPLGKLWTRMSVTAQRDRAVQAECLYAAAERKTACTSWYSEGLLPRTFRAKQMVLGLHVWLLHRRLAGAQSGDCADENKLVQEHVFELLWTDATGRIRAEPDVPEMRVAKYLKSAQQLTFQSYMHYDHALSLPSREEAHSDLSTALWHHVYQSSSSVPDDAVHRLTDYVFAAHDHVMNVHSPEHWKEGRTPFPDSMLPDWAKIVDNEGKVLHVPPYDPADDPWFLPGGWLAAQTEAGERYYWHPKTRKAQWEHPDTISAA